MHTKEERAKKVREAMAINSLDGAEPSKECQEWMEQYVVGEMTLEEVQEKIKAKYIEMIKNEK